MTTSSLCLLCALGFLPPTGTGSVYIPTNPDQILIRGQSPVVHSTAPWGSAPLGQASPWATTVSVPRTAQQDYYADPFLNPGGGIAPYGGPPGPAPNSGPYGTPPVYNRFGGPVGVSGINGPQPYRYGWKPRFDFGYLPKQDVSYGSEQFGIFEMDSEFRNTLPLSNGSVFSYAPQFSWRNWTTPGLPGGGELPNSVYRVGTDFEWSTSAAGPWSLTVGFNPSINSDFQRSLTSDAYNLDARAMLFYRASPQWMYVFGVGYLDRVNDRVLPYSGVVWTPNDRTELRLMFPESRISHYIGNYFSDDKWLYASAGFHVEAYQVEIQRTNAEYREKIEISDWRAVIGLRSENDYLSTFIEGGIVFDRQVDFLHGTPNFDIDSGFILRGGFRF
ncbi:MAG: hypothetical protein KDA84_13595 [Planctomycetaceae bacterium]|nr:hypothetical protein [Planctomycetaceae bacterium]